MRFILVPLGSAGDVHPLVGLGLALRARGHALTLITSGYFAPLARRLELDFVPLDSGAEFLALTENPDIWSPYRGFVTIARAMLPMIRKVYEAVRERYVPGATVVVAATLGLGARLAQEKLGVPLATIHLQPCMFRSVHQAPVMPLMFMPDWAPQWWKRLSFWCADSLVIDRVIGTDLNRFRAELGLPPVRRPFKDWLHSPERAIGLFPDWFAPPQPDWPAQARCTGFPLYDERGATELPEEARAFLEQGTPPIVFTPGSAMRFGQRFFEEAVSACQLLGRRGLLLTRFSEQLPARLPVGVRHFDYLPLSQVLPRAAALVHHGGIGTASQGLAAGIPQLVMPMSHDQPDNAARLQHLGVARTLKPGCFRAPAVTRALEQLLGSPKTTSCCQEIARRIRQSDPLADTCRLIEELLLLHNS